MNDDAAERESLDDALFVLHGDDGTGTIRRLLYAGYLVLIFGGVYGFNVLRAVLVTSDPQWVRSAVVSVWAVLALLAVLAGSGRGALDRKNPARELYLSLIHI